MHDTHTGCCCSNGPSDHQKSTGHTPSEPYPRRVARPHFPGKQRRMQLARAVLLQLAGRDKGEMMKVLKKTRQCTEAHVLVGPYQTKSMTPVPASILANPCGNGMIAV